MLAALIAAYENAAPAAQKSSPGSPPSQSAEASELARQAQNALNRGESENAVRDYDRLVKIAPAVAEYRLNLCSAYYTSDRPSDAVPWFRQALKLKPALALARHYLGASLAESGRCEEAIPLLFKEGPHIADSHLKRTVQADGLKCAMALDQEDRPLDFIRLLQRQFPKDPEVLYLPVHVYSDLSTGASPRLLVPAPSSPNGIRIVWLDERARRRVLEVAESSHRHTPVRNTRVGPDLTKAQVR